MIHQDFQNVRSFADFAAIRVPWPCSMNDRARLWNMLVRFNINRQGRADLMTHEASFTDQEFNVSYGSYFGSVSKITKLYRYILQNRRLRIVGNARNVDGTVTYMLSIGSSANELLDAWNPVGLASYTGRGRSAGSASLASRRRRQNRSNYQSFATVSAAPAVEGPSNPEARRRDGFVDDGSCNCEECRTVRRSEIQRQELENARNRDTRAAVARLLEGFLPFENLSASVMATLMIEATT